MRFGPTRHRRRGTTRVASARLVIVYSVAIVVALALIGGTGLVGPAGAQTPTPTPTPTGPGGPKITLINPSEGLDPVLVDPREPADSPNISDRFDGLNTAYHITASVTGSPANAIVEAAWVPDGANEITAGTLQRVGTTDVWELQWEIPASVPEGEGILRVYLYEQRASGLEQVAVDEVVATMRHEGEPTADPLPAEETVELTWPTQGGPIGFFKSKLGAWRTVVDGSVSAFGNRVDLAYSTAPVGADPVWTFCGSAGTTINAQGGVTAAGANGARTFRRVCTLASADVPSKVTAMGAIALEPDTPSHSGVFTNDSSDAHRVAPYLQNPSTMKVDLIPVPPASATAAWPTGKRRVAGSDCLAVDVFVTDPLDRPVQGANVDLHMTGPSDQVGFGDEASASTGSSADQPPNEAKDSHNVEQAWDCDAPGDRFGEQGDTNVPGGDDVKHIESAVAGTGMSGPANAQFFFGKFRAHYFSEDVGFSDVVAWVDEPPVSEVQEEREADSDTFDAGEKSDALRAQWLPQGINISFSPTGVSAPPGQCTPITVRVRSGSRAVPGINVDLHGTGPDNQLDFCDPAEGSPRSAPNAAAANHTNEDQGEASHGGDPPQAQHTETETDDSGNLTVGLISPITGDTTIQAWVDGEALKDQNNDVLDSGEVNARASMNWLSSLAQAQLSFINPSPYGASGTPGSGNGTRVANTRDADSLYDVVVRVDAIGVPGVELLVSQDATTFRKLGDMTQIAESDLWQFDWNVDATEDSSPTLRAQIIGTDRREDIQISVNNAGGTGPPPSRAYETAKIQSPINGTVAAFLNGALEIKGTASSGAEGVELYYTKAPAKDTPQGADWLFCGYVDLSGTGTTPQTFAGQCRLQASDQASLVTGVAAVTFDCGAPLPANDGCDGNPAASPARQPGEKESGDAHRIYGIEGAPLLQLEPAESSGVIRTCQPLTLRLTDATGQALGGENVDVHLTGPNDGARFCQPQGGSTRRAPDEGAHTGAETDEGLHTESDPDTHHTEGETRPNGTFSFGVTSNAKGDSNITIWVDRNDDDVPDSAESSDISVLHWVKRASGSGGKKCTERGTQGSDVLRGTSGTDVLCGLGGKDRLIGLGGKDTLVGGKGNDKLLGGRGNDRLSGAEGADLLKGGRGRDKLNGGLGKDRLTGGSGRDFCAGGRGSDRSKGCETNRKRG